jgi:hypothetical protein
VAKVPLDKECVSPVQPSDACGWAQANKVASIMKKSRQELSPFVRFFDAWGSDTDNQLAHGRAFWEESGNPYYVWEAIDICAKNKLDLPPWVRSYLDLCARNMMNAAQSKASKDLRESLPGILSFPAKRGRGHPLRPDGEGTEYMTAAMVFAAEIAKGQKPKDALHKASESLDRPLADDIGDKTLLEHIKRQFGVKKAPRTNAEWNRLIRAWYLGTFGRLEMRFRDLSTCIK